MRVVDNAMKSPDGCWLWLGYCKPDGYGRTVLRGSSWYAHRLAYEQEVGPIPVGLSVDHLCRQRSCVNPNHLEPVTHAENLRRTRGLQPSQRPSVCRNGHNDWQKSGDHRRCRTCHNEYQRKRLRAKKESA